MSLTEISNPDDFRELICTEGLTLTFFFATWCDQCKAIEPHLNKLPNEFTDVQFLKVDVEEASEIAEEYIVTEIPTLIWFIDGQPINKVVDPNPDEIRDLIEEFH